MFGGTGIPFGENNGNDIHVCNVQYKRWNLLSCRGKKPNKIYGQVAFPPWRCAASFGVTRDECFAPIPGDDHHKRLSVCVWRNNRISVQHRPAQAGPDHQGVEPPEAQQCTHRPTWRKVWQNCFNLIMCLRPASGEIWWKMNLWCYRYRHELAHDGQRIYILGGGTSWTSYPMDKVV